MSFNYRFSVIPAGAITDTRLTPYALRVLCLLGRHTNDAGWCSRSQVKMARELACGRSTIYDALEVLVDTGYVEKRANGRGGRTPESADHPFSSYSYRVSLDRENLPERLQAEANESTPSKAENEPPEPAAPAAGGAAATAGPAALAAPLEGISSEGISSEPERETRARDHEKFAKWLSQFLLRWPTSASDDQTRVSNAARALTEAERERALDRIPAFLENHRRIGRKHIPAGWRYLEQKSFDLIEQPKAGGAVPTLIDVHEGTPLFEVWAAIYRVAKARQGWPSYMVSGQAPHRLIRVRKELPEALICIADPNREWRTVVEGGEPRGQFAAWLRWITDIVPASHVSFADVAGKRALTVPAPWPPNVNGQLGPPKEKDDAA